MTDEKKCSSCKHWDNSIGKVWGICRVHSDNPEEVDWLTEIELEGIEEAVEEITDRWFNCKGEFGCIQWEDKP